MKSASLSALVMWSQEKSGVNIFENMFLGGKRKADSNKGCNIGFCCAVCFGRAVQVVFSLSDSL